MLVIILPTDVMVGVILGPCSSLKWPVVSVQTLIVVDSYESDCNLTSCLCGSRWIQFVNDSRWIETCSIPMGKRKSGDGVGGSKRSKVKEEIGPDGRIQGQKILEFSKPVVDMFRSWWTLCLNYVWFTAVPLIIMIINYYCDCVLTYKRWGPRSWLSTSRSIVTLTAHSTPRQVKAHSSIRLEILCLYYLFALTGKGMWVPLLDWPLFPTFRRCVQALVCFLRFVLPFKMLHHKAPRWLRTYAKTGDLMATGPLSLRPWHFPWVPECGFKGVPDPARCSVSVSLNLVLT